MPERYFEQGGEFMVPRSEDDATSLIFIHALRANADAMKRMADQQDRISGKVDGVSDLIHHMDKRLAVIEANSLAPAVKDHEARIVALEGDRNRRVGAVGALDATAKYGPMALAIIGALFLVMVVTGKIVL